MPRMQRGHDQDRLARQWQPHALEPNRERERPVAILSEARLVAAARVAKEAEEKRLIQERQAEEARKADAAHAQLEASQSEAPPYIADKFKRAFERGRSTWLNAQ
jgi:hypothetical protein